MPLPGRFGLRDHDSREIATPAPRHARGGQ
jgi:hypothetical protein